MISSAAQLMINDFKNRYNNISSLAVDAPLTLMGNTAPGGKSCGDCSGINSLLFYCRR